MSVFIQRCLVALALVLAFNAQANDPVKLEWMQGFPPAKEKTLSSVDGSFFEFPALRWSVVHMRQFLPTVNVSRGLGAPSPLDYALDPKIDTVEFNPWNADKPMSWQASLEENYTDGILILHRGKVVYERYFGELQEDRKHAVMSVTKSFTGTLAAGLVAQGKLDKNAAVTDYVPELAGSAFGTANVSQVMDMTTCLDYSEDYANPEAEVWEYAKASNFLTQPSNANETSGTLHYLTTLEKQKNCTHGEVFAYKTPNADVLGWIISRATNTPLADLLSQNIWRQLGMEQSAYYQVDSKGIASSGGGLSAGMRDLGRFGQMLLNEGVWRGKQVLPKSVIADIRAGGNPEAFARSDNPNLVGWSYKNMWWVTHNANGAFAARGVHGQTIYIDPTAEMVIVRLASHPVAGNAANDAKSLPAYQAVADYLSNPDSK